MEELLSGRAKTNYQSMQQVIRPCMAPIAHTLGSRGVLNDI